MKRALVPVIGIALLAAACSGDEAGTTSSLAPTTTPAAATTTAAPATTTTVAPPTTSAAPVTTTTTSAPTTSTPAVFLSAEAKWEGEVQTITLYDDGTLVAGSAQGQADITSTDPYWIGEQAKISVVELGAEGFSQAILVEIPVAEEEDPPNFNQLFVAEGKLLRRVLNESLGVYSVTELTFVGDGTIEYQEDGWTACARADFPEEANRQFVTLGFVGDEIGEIGRRDSAETQVCDQLAG